jgi:hypothetical protein
MIAATTRTTTRSASRSASTLDEVLNAAEIGAPKTLAAAPSDSC